MAGEFNGTQYIVQVSIDSGTTYNTVEGATAHDDTQTNEDIDITNKDSQWQKLLEGGKKSVSGSISGFINSGTGYVNLRSCARGTNAGDFLMLKLIENSGNYTEGTFKLSSWQQSAPDKQGSTFSCSFTSSGDVTYTVA